MRARNDDVPVSEKERYEMSDSQNKDKHNRFRVVLGELLTIFGAAFTVVTYVVPTESTREKLALSLVIVSVSTLIFRVIHILLARKRIDLIVSLFTFVTVGLMAWYTFILVASREAKNEALETSPPGTGSSVGRGNAPKQAPNSSNPPNLRDFPPSLEEVSSTGSATLRIGGQEGLDPGGWRVRNEDYSSIIFEQTGLVGRNNAEFGLLAEDSDISFATCRDHIAWTPVIDRQQVQRGSFACLRWEGRRGILRIDSTPDFDENRPSVVLTGRVWAEIVDH